MHAPQPPAAPAPFAGFGELISRLDAAVAHGDPNAVTADVKRALEELIRDGRVALPDRFRQPRSDTYARRLLHRDPHGAYTAIVMNWGPGQATALHDHAGVWCVEGVVEGRMVVTQYDLAGVEDDAYGFVEQNRVEACVGSAGCLIPPFEYHVLANAQRDRPSITLHVYGGEMTSCHVFERRPDGRYERHTRQLVYHE